MIQLAIASVLKPAKDARAYYKMAISLRETNKYYINIIGFSSKKETSEKNIKFSTCCISPNKISNRLLAGWNLLKILAESPPAVLIVTTWELIPAALLGKLIWRFKLIYDVQENYSLNAKLNNPSKGCLSRWLHSKLIQMVESLSKSWIDLYFFAEKCYQTELPSFRPSIVFQNTYSGKEIHEQNIKLSKDKPLRFLITGTLTPVYGTIEGIYWFKELLKHYSNSTLQILGHCPSLDFEQELIDLIYHETKISLNSSQYPIPYQQLIEATQATDIVLLPYHQLPSISPKIPSKVFECMALKKPMIYQKNQKLTEFIAPYKAGLAIDFNNLDSVEDIKNKILSTEFYSTERIDNALWKTRENEFLNTIQRISATKNQFLER